MEAVLKTSLFFLKRINLLKCFKSFKVLYLLVVKLGEIFVQWTRLLRTEKGGIHSLFPPEPLRRRWTDRGSSWPWPFSWVSLTQNWWVTQKRLPFSQSWVEKTRTSETCIQGKATLLVGNRKSNTNQRKQKDDWLVSTPRMSTGGAGLIWFPCPQWLLQRCTGDPIREKEL